MKKQRASSLILVLVVIASIMTITLGTQRVSLVQFAQSNREEDSLYALYAAKGAIEHGLNIFRHSRNAQTQDGKVFRFDLTAGVADNNSDRGHGFEVNADTDVKTFKKSPSDNGYSPTHQYYGLNVDFKAPQINSGNFSLDRTVPDNQWTGLELPTDEAFSLTGFSNDGGLDYFLRYRFKFIGSSCLTDGAFVQIELLRDTYNTGDVLEQRKVDIGANNFVDSIGSSNIAISAGTNPIRSVRMRSYRCPVKYAFRTTTNSAGGPADGPKFDGLMNSDGTKFITRLTATGYFGQAKRTLIGEIDRVSGQLIGIYDFNAYAGNNLCRPHPTLPGQCAP